MPRFLCEMIRCEPSKSSTGFLADAGGCPTSWAGCASFSLPTLQITCTAASSPSMADGWLVSGVGTEACGSTLELDCYSRVEWMGNQDLAVAPLRVGENPSF